MDKKSLTATGWAFGAECAAKIMVPLTNMLLARILTPDAFGIIVTINMIISFAEMITSAGFHKYLIQREFQSECEKTNAANVAFWSNLFISMLAFLIITVFNEQLAVLVGSEGYGLSIVVASIALPLTSFSSIYEGLYKRDLEYSILFWNRVIVCIVPLVITCPLALLGIGHWALIIGTLFSALIRDVIFILYKNRKWWPSVYYNITALKKMLSFGIWTFFESLTSWLINWVDVFLVANCLNAFYTGLYKTAQSTVSSILSIITSATQPVLFSILSRYQNDHDSFEKRFVGYIRVAGVAIIPISVGIYAYSDAVTKILLGSQWMEAAKFIGLWGLVSGLVCLFGEYNREAYRAIGKPAIAFLVQLLHLLFIVPICVYSVRLGFDTMAVNRSLAYLQVLLLHFICLKLILRIKVWSVLKSVLIPSLAATVMFGFAVVMRNTMGTDLIMELVQIIICMVVYFGVILMFRSYREIVLSAAKGVLHRFMKRS